MQTADYGTGVEATVFIQGEFKTIEFSADLDAVSSYKVASIEGIEPNSGFDVDTTFTATATDGDGDTVDATFNVSLDAGEMLEGTAGDDVIVGNGCSQTLISGAGDDIMTGGLDADTFQIDAFDTMRVDTNTITDFSVAQGDILDLKGLLTGVGSEDGATLDNFLSFDFDGFDTTIDIDANGNGSGTDVQVVLTGFDATNGGALATDEDIIDNLLSTSSLDAL